VRTFRSIMAMRGRVRSNCAAAPRIGPVHRSPPRTGAAPAFRYGGRVGVRLTFLAFLTDWVYSLACRSYSALACLLVASCSSMTWAWWTQRV
jgi:hypothetical protein